MTEIPARYRVGNIIHVDFDRIPTSMRRQVGMPVSGEFGALWQSSAASYLQAISTPKLFTSQSRAALVLALTKLLEAETDGDRCVLLALRLATVELQMAITDCSEKPDAKRFFADQTLVHLQSILDFVGNGVHAIEDGDQLVVAPTAIHMRMAAAHLLLGAERNAAMCMEFAEESLGRLDGEGSDWMRGRFLEQMIQLRRQF